MASLKDIKIKQAKEKYEAAKKKGDKTGMVRAHADADRARGQYTKTVVVDGQYQQKAIGTMGQKAASGELLDATRKLNQAKPQTPTNAPTAVKARTGLATTSTAKKKANILEQAFDKEENYIDKAKKGNIGGAAANFVGTGLTAAQTLYLNAANAADSVTQRKGLPKYQQQMDFADYDKAVAERRGAVPTIEKATKINPVLGGAYRLIGEVGTDPLELLPGGMVNDIKLAKGTAQGSAAYADALKAGKMSPAGQNIVKASRATEKIPTVGPDGKIKYQAVPKNIPAQRVSDIPIVKPQPETTARNAQITPEPRKGNLGVVASQKRAAAENVDFIQNIDEAVKYRDGIQKTLNEMDARQSKGNFVLGDVKKRAAVENALQDANERIQKFKSLGADTNKGEKTIDQLVDEYGALPKGEAPRAREVDIPKKTDYGDTQQYARTLQESAIVDDTLFKDINEAITQGSFTKPTIGNKTVVDDANTVIENIGLDEAVEKFKSVLRAEKQPNSYDIALGNRVLQELQKTGRYDEALSVAIDLSDILSETGRTLQAARIAKRLSPEGRLMIASRTAQKVAKKTGIDIQLSDDVIKDISEAATESEIVKANQKAAKQIWDQVPANWVDKVNSWRYMSMLFNPKTHVRNIVGNSIFLPVREFKNLLGSVIEGAVIRDGTRTKAVLNPIKDKAIMKFASDDFQNVKALLKNEGKLDDTVRTLDAKVFNNPVLEGIRKLNLGALDVEDTWFMKFAYDSSLSQYMKANRLKPDAMVGETLEAARKYAMNEALKATYRDANALASLISRGKSTLSSGKYGLAGRAGGLALEGVMPFTKTPMNIVKRGLGYSPANLVRGIANLRKVKSGKITATEVIDELASGLSGTALLGLGTYLGYNNIVKGKEGEYKDKLYNYNQMLGSQNYSLNIDGGSYTLDWAAPDSMPFFVGVELSKAIRDRNADLATVIDSMTQISDPMVNLSMLKGINDIMTNNFEGFGQTFMDIGTGYAGQYNPTLFGQIARTADDTRRSTISTQETGMGRAAEKFGRKQLGKVPVASKNLEPYVDLWGREQKTGGLGRRVLENFLSPGYFKEENITPVDQELISLAKNLDEETAKKVLPTNTAYQYTLEASSEKYRMTEQESTAYQKMRGQESFKGLRTLFAAGNYQSMTADEKAKAVSDVYSQAAKTAKMEFLKSRGLSPMLAMTTKQQENYGQIASLGVKEDQYINAFNATKDIESAKDDGGKTIPLSESYLKKKAIDAKNPGASPQELMALYHAFGVSQKVWNFN